MKKIIAIIVGVIILTGMMNVSNIFSNEVKAQEADNNDKFAVIVGISDYEEVRPWYLPSPDLPFPAMNAKNLKLTLETHGWENAEIHLLINESATKVNIINELNWLKDQTGTVLFFFNGHGASIDDDNNDEGLIDGKDEALVPYDAYHSSSGEIVVETLIRDDDLNKIIKDFKSEEAVLIFCTCHSEGMIEDSLGYKPLEIFNGEPDEYIRIHNEIVEVTNEYNKGLIDELQGENRVVMASCGEAFLTREFPEGSEILGFEGVPFVHYLIKAFEGAGDLAGNNDGQVSAEEAFNYMKPRADVLNTIGYLKYLATAPLAIMITLLAAYCVIISVFATIDLLIHGESMPFLQALLWLDIYAILKSWFEEYGEKLPIAQINDYNENLDIQLTNAEAYSQKKAPEQGGLDKEKYENDIQKQLEILDEYFGEGEEDDDSTSKSFVQKPVLDFGFIRFLQNFFKCLNLKLQG